jgi:hypothetical protein
MIKGECLSMASTVLAHAVVGLTGAVSCEAGKPLGLFWQGRLTHK